MKIFFWDFQDDNDIIREWVLFGINIVVLAFTCFSLVRTWKQYRICMFEMLPLSINVVATFILLLLKLFQKGYEFGLIGQFIEIFTYFLFCYTFAIMHTLISNPHHRKLAQKIWSMLLLILTLMLLALSILVFTGIISKKCDSDNQKIPSIVCLVFEFISFIPTGYYGGKILSRMYQKQQIDPELKDELNSFTSELYVHQRKKQIIMVLATYIVSLIIRLIVTLATIFMDKYFSCTLIDNSYIITSDFVIGQLVLSFAQFNQLFPHVAIPIAMYVVPLQKMSRKSKQIKLEQSFIDEEEYDGVHQDHAHHRVSSILTSRLSDCSPNYRKTNSIATISNADNQGS